MSGVLAAAERVDEPAAFTRGPRATSQGGGFRIEFAVSRPTDAAVRVEDRSGAVVRHLAAGVLGASPPEPFKAGALEQTLVWDGKDDLGRPVAPSRGPFTVRVSLGLRPAFASLIGDDPRNLGSVRALAVGPDGNVYVFHAHSGNHPNDSTTSISVLSRNAAYLRTIVPFRADLPEERLKGLRRITAENGATSPFVYAYDTRACLPGLGDLPSQRPIVTEDGRLAFVGIQEGPKCFAQPGEARLTIIYTDGGVPDDGVLSTLIHPLTDTGANLALSPDGKFIYATGIRAGLHPNTANGLFVCNNCDHRGSTWRHTVPTHAVYRFGWGDVQVGEFVGDPAQSGNAPNQLNEPVSVATDGKGNVYVADWGNDRIAVFQPDGTPLAQIKVDHPERVEVHRKTGAIYVLSSSGDLVKFDGYEHGREVARLSLGRPGRGASPIRRPVIALDDMTDPPLIWVGSPLLRIEDKGTTFGDPLDVRATDPNSEDAMGSAMEMSLDRARGLLYVNNRRRYDVTTGRYETVSVVGGRMWPSASPGSASGSVGRDGNYYVNEGARRARLHRYGPDLKPFPFPNADASSDRALGPEAEIGPPGTLRGYSRNRTRGQTADAYGNVYVLWKKSPNEPGDAHRAHWLSKYAPDGTLLEQQLVDSSIPSVSSVRVDPAGNIYLAVGVRPGTDLLPPGLAGARAEPADPDCVNEVNSYAMMYGSIVKFGPEGGTILHPVGYPVTVSGNERLALARQPGERVRPGLKVTPCNYATGTPIEVAGAKWVFSGASVVSSWATPKRAPNTQIVCLCESPCIDVDDYGRTFFPDAGRARVGVLDTAGNLVCWFGRYGNPDSGGPRSALPTPTIPLWWPQAVAASDEAAYVGDRLNRRIVSVRLAYAAEKTCAVP